jgi:hypothetical protein
MARARTFIWASGGVVLYDAPAMSTTQRTRFPAGFLVLMELLAALLFVAGCGGSDFEVVESPTSTRLRRVWADEKGHFWAVGQIGAIVHYDGSSFKLEDAAGVRSTLSDVHGSAHDNIWVVGDDATVLRYDGASWTKQESPIDDHLLAVRVFSPDDILIASLTRVFRGHPGAWNEIELSGNYECIWDAGPSDVWMLDGLSDIVHYDGAGWTDVKHGLPGIQLWSDIWGTGNSFWALGSNPGSDSDWILKWNGSTFSQESHSWYDEGMAEGIGGSSEKDIFRVGGEGFIARFDGSRWETLSPPDDSAFLFDVAATARDVVAVGEDGVIWHQRR